jgi:hypothetical protein
VLARVCRFESCSGHKKRISQLRYLLFFCGKHNPGDSLFRCLSIPLKITIMKFPKSVLLFSILGLFLSSCTFYEDGPYISLTPKKERIANVWTAEKVTRADGEDITDNYKNWTWTFTADGDAKVAYPVLGSTITFNGEWNLVESDKVFQLIVDFGIGNSIADYDILRLANKEFWLLAEDGNEFRLKGQ